MRSAVLRDPHYLLGRMVDDKAIVVCEFIVTHRHTNQQQVWLDRLAT